MSRSALGKNVQVGIPIVTLQGSNDLPILARFRLVTRVEHWRLTRRGWLVLCPVLLLLLAVALVETNGFLSVNKPIDAQVLVVEEYLPEYGIKSALAEFQDRNYRQLLTPGGPIEQGALLLGFNNHAEQNAAVAKKLGMASAAIVPLPAGATKNDRIYMEALAVRNWLAASNATVHSLNLVVRGPCARVARLLFQKALGPKVAVGVLSIPSQDYNPKRWWTTSAGVRDTLSAAIWYLYVRFFFHP